MPLSRTVEWHRLGSRPRTPVPGQRLFLSSETRWEALRVDLIHLTGPSELPETIFPEHVLVAHVDGPARTNIWFGGSLQTGDVFPGDICIVPAATPCAVRREQPGRIVSTRLSARLVDEIAGDARVANGLEVQPRLGARDPLMNELLLALTNEVLADNPGGPLYAETLGAALAAQLLRRHSAGFSAARTSRALGPRTFRLLSEYVEAHLTGPIRLGELAEIAGMSTYQLVRRFKESSGLPPHHYVTRRRIERAKELLREPGTSVLEVAVACGFSSPSHFAQAFRLLTGVTPRDYRAASD